jgi:hypothetical protein
MKINIQIDDNKEIQLSALKGKMLMKDSFLYRIEDYEIQEVTETPEKTFFNRHPKTKNILMLTSITVRAYHGDAKFLGYLKEDACRHLLSWFNLFGFRNIWLQFNEQLQAFGLEIREIEPQTKLEIETTKNETK